jgi:hypothetical protein
MPTDGSSGIAEEYIRPRLHLICHEYREVVQLSKLMQRRQMPSELLLTFG